jgi:hypothetical protein
MKLMSISSWQRHLFKRETLQWSSIGVRTSVERLFEIYKLSSPPVEVSVDPSGRLPLIVGAGGEYRLNDKRQTIEQLVIDPVSIQFQITGDTSTADVFYADLLEKIETAGETTIDRSSCLARTIQTVTIAKMEIDYWRFYSNEWKKFLHSKIEPLVQMPDASHKIMPNAFSFLIAYQRAATDYLLNPKPFVIEPRAGTTADEGIFFAQSPTDSATHLRLIEELEGTFHKTVEHQTL